MHITLAPVWEALGFSDTGVISIGVVLLLIGAFGLGFEQGRGEGSGTLPVRVQLAIAAGVIGVILLAAVAASNDSGCEPGECDEPGPDAFHHAGPEDKYA